MIYNKDKDHWKNEAVAFFALTSIKGINYWSIYNIYKKDFSLKNLLKVDSQTEFETLLGTSIKSYQDKTWNEQCKNIWDAGLACARSLHQKKIKLLFYGQPEFPESLKNIKDGPRWIFVQGDIQNLYKKSIAIVGSRSPSDDGVFLTKYLMTFIKNTNFITVSGLAHGIDQHAHIESLRYNIPTVAVLGTGILQDYPIGSEYIRTQILEKGGTIVSEYLPNQSFSAQNFVRRNRIQAALATVIIPVEWKVKSGTAHTVAFAYKYQKKIINICLPNTYEIRQELHFSKLKYGACSLEVPIEQSKLFDLLHSDPGHITQHKLKNNQGELNFE